MMQLINDEWYKRRDLISDGYDSSLNNISKIIPLEILEFPTGMKCWTWTIPEKWSVKEAYIEDLDGNRILDLKDHPLHIISYSLPIEKTISKEELLQHIHTNPKRPDAIPFEFKYYEKDWGFCMEHNKLEKINSEKYHVFIDSSFTAGSLKVGDYTIKGKSDEIIVIVAHLCHPAMVNDDLTGVSVLVDVAKTISKKDNYYNYKFLILPETIGSIAYLSQNENIIPKLKFGIFLEMLGNDNIHTLQLSKRGDTKLDRICRYVMKRKLTTFKEGPFREVIANDEMVFDGPGVDVPMVSISRYPYPEYHTSDDNPSLISEENLNESKNLILEILRVIDTDYTPKRLFKGPIFLSGYGLWVDWRINRKLNKNIEQIMLRLEGDKTIFDITEELEMEFDDVLNYVNKFIEKELVKKV